MTNVRVLVASLLVLAAVTCVAAPAQAYDFGLGDNCNLYGYRSASSLYSLGYIPTPPYYAIHPPVYYGQRYFRTYGESPYARPARSSRPLIVDVQLIKNPFYQGAVTMPAMPEVDAIEQRDTTQDVEPEDQVAATPTAQLIINPYYQADTVVRN